MTTTHNSIQLRHSIALDRNTRLVNSLTQAGINNLKPDLSVVDTILGLKARSAADYGKKIVSNMGTGFNMINTARSTIKDLRAQLEKIKQDTASLNAADAPTLTTAQNDFQNNVIQIITTLSNLNFIGRKLTNGSIAVTTGANLANTGIDAASGPFQVQSQIDGNGYIGISVPRLIAGDALTATGQDPASVAGTFQPLFGLNATNANAAAAARSIANAGPANAANVAALAAGGTPEDTIVGNYAQQVALDAVAAGVANGSAALKIIYSKAAIDKAAALTAGDVTTAAGRVAVAQLMDQKIAILDTVIASVTGKENSLKAARSNMEAQIVELDDAANNYLLANYKEIISKIAESARSLKVISLVDVMYEKTLNGQINSLEATAASVAA